MSTKFDIDALYQSISESFTFLEGYGFASRTSPVLDKDELVGDCWDWDYFSASRNAYFHVSKGSEKWPTLVRFSMMDTETQSGFSVQRWLDYFKKDFTMVSEITDHSLQGYRVFAEQLASDFKQALSFGLEDVLAGKRWDIVPMDWGDYK